MALGVIYNTLATTVLAQLRTAEALEWYGKGAALAERLQSLPLLTEAAQHSGVSLMYTGHIAEGEERLERSWELAAGRQLAYQADWCRARAARIVVSLKRPRQGMSWAQRKPDFHTMAVMTVAEEVVALHGLFGDGSAGRGALRQMLWKADSSGVTTPFADWTILLLNLGEWDEARQVLENTLAQNRQAKALYPAMHVAPLLGRFCLDTGDCSAGEEHLGSALEWFRQGGFLTYELSILPLVCELYVESGRLDQAEVHLQEARTILANGEDWAGLAGDVALAEGLLRGAQGRWPEAEAGFQRAVAVDQQYELRWDEAKVYYEWGCSLVAVVGAVLRDRPGAGVGEEHGCREQARALLGKAAEMWEAMGARPWAEKCRARLAELA